MKPAQRLEIGLVSSGGIQGEVIKEVLCHQGLPLQNTTATSKEDTKLPCIILPTYTDVNFDLAKKNCLSEDNIIIADRDVPLDLISRALSGQLEAPLGDPINPVVNQYEVALLAKIREMYANLGLPLIRKWFWPHFQNACCVLTHDVDWLHYSPWHWASLRRKTIPQIVKLAYQSIFKRKNYGNNISQIVSKEIEKNVKSSFYFLTKYEESYHEEFIGSLKELRKDEFEIGLHGYYSHESLERLKEQKATLEKYINAEIRGIRQHELNFTTPLTWKYEEEVGFSYDLTLAYNDKIGFRSGICFPHHPIDMVQSKRQSIIEMPTSFMDWTILHRKMDYEEAVQVFAKLRENVEKFNGALVTCFHNTYQNKETFPEMNRLYSEILNDLTQRSYWIATANECCQWWLRREKTDVSLTIKDKVVEGKATTHPLPLIVENLDGDKKFVEVQQQNFEIDVN